MALGHVAHGCCQSVIALPGDDAHRLGAVGGSFPVGDIRIRLGSWSLLATDTLVSEAVYSESNFAAKPFCRRHFGVRCSATCFAGSKPATLSVVDS